MTLYICGSQQGQQQCLWALEGIVFLRGVGKFTPELRLTSTCEKVVCNIYNAYQFTPFPRDKTPFYRKNNSLLQCFCQLSAEQLHAPLTGTGHQYQYHL